MTYTNPADLPRPVVDADSRAAFGFATDNPGGGWLRFEVKRATERQAEGSDPYRFRGSVTGYFKRTFYLPTAMLVGVQGANDEDRRPGDGKFDRLMRLVEAEGWNQEHAAMLRITDEGKPVLLEGNTRVAVAKVLGVEWVLVEVYYVNGGERQPGAWAPQAVMDAARLLVGEPA